MNRIHLDGRTRVNGDRESTITCVPGGLLIVGWRLTKSRTRRTESTTTPIESEANVSPPISFDVTFPDKSIVTQMAVLPQDEPPFSFQDVSPTNLHRDIDSTSYASRGTVPQAIPSPLPRHQLTTDRFEAYIEDNLGSYAPSFQGRNSGRSSDHGSHSVFELHDLADPIRRLEVEMGTRTTLDLELQVTNLDSADMEYLKSKGNTS